MKRRRVRNPGRVELQRHPMPFNACRLNLDDAVWLEKAYDPAVVRGRWDAAYRITEYYRDLALDVAGQASVTMNAAMPVFQSFDSAAAFRAIAVLVRETQAARMLVGILRGDLWSAKTLMRVTVSDRNKKVDVVEYQKFYEHMASNVETYLSLRAAFIDSGRKDSVTVMEHMGRANVAAYNVAAQAEKLLGQAYGHIAELEPAWDTTSIADLRNASSMAATDLAVLLDQLSSLAGMFGTEHDKMFVSLPSSWGQRTYDALIRDARRAVETGVKDAASKMSPKGASPIVDAALAAGLSPPETVTATARALEARGALVAAYPPGALSPEGDEMWPSITIEWGGTRALGPKVIEKIKKAGFEVEHPRRFVWIDAPKRNPARRPRRKRKDS